MLQMISSFGKRNRSWLVIGMFLPSLHITFAGTAWADTNVQLKVGGYRTVTLSKAADRITNHNPEILQISSLESRKQIRIQGISEGVGSVEALTYLPGGELKSRRFRVSVRGTKSTTQTAQPSEGQQLRPILTQSMLPAGIKGSPAGNRFLLSGELRSIESLETLLALFRQDLSRAIPVYKISHQNRRAIIQYLNQRLRSRGSGVVHNNPTTQSLVISGVDHHDTETVKFASQICELLPRCDFNTEKRHDDTLVRVSFHFVESNLSERDLTGHSVPGVHSPLSGTLSPEGLRPAPLQFHIQYLSQASETRVLEQPSLLTRSGEPALLISGGEMGLLQSSDGTPPTTEFKPYGLRAAVTPHTLQTGQIDLNMDLTISDPQIISAGGKPQFSKRQIKTFLRVDDGLANLIARITSKRDTSGRQGDPFLKSIPLLSWIFSKRQSKNDHRELWVFVSAQSSLYQNFGRNQPLSALGTGE